MEHGKDVVSASFSPSCDYLAQGANKCKVYDVSDKHGDGALGQCKKIEIAGVKIRVVAFSPDGAYLAVGDDKGGATLYDCRGKKPKKWPPVKRFPAPAAALALAEGASVACAAFAYGPLTLCVARGAGGAAAYFRCADIPRMSRGDAAVGTWIFRGNESRRRRGWDVDIPRK